MVAVSRVGDCDAITIADQCLRQEPKRKIEGNAVFISSTPEFTSPQC
jgi:hypothetical protein